MANIFRINGIFRNILHYFETTELSKLMTINSYWKKTILKKFQRGFQKSMKLDRLFVLYESLKNKYPIFAMDASNFVTFVRETQVEKLGIKISLLFNKINKVVYLGVVCFNGYRNLIQLNSQTFEDTTISKNGILSDIFHLNHRKQYVYHFVNGISVMIYFDDNLDINYKFYDGRLFSHNSSLSDTFLKRFQLCNKCLNCDPIEINKQFFAKFQKYQDQSSFCHRWKTVNMGFEIWKMGKLKIYLQLIENDTLIFKKLRIPLSENNFAIKFSKGILVLENNWQSNKYEIKVINCLNNVKIVVNKSNSIPIFGKLIWIKKSNQFIIIDKCWYMNYLAISTSSRDEKLPNEQGISFVNFCQETKRLILWYENRVEVLNIDRFYH